MGFLGLQSRVARAGSSLGSLLEIDRRGFETTTLHFPGRVSDYTSVRTRVDEESPSQDHALEAQFAFRANHPETTGLNVLESGMQFQPRLDGKMSTELLSSGSFALCEALDE